MAHRKTETIALPQGVTPEDVKSKLNAWLGSETGRKFSLKSRGDTFLSLERKWTPTWKYLFLCFGILPGICCILLSKSWINLNIQIGDTAVQLDLETNDRNEGESTFQSLIFAIQGSSSSGQATGPTDW